MCIVISFASPVSLCLFVPAMFPCVSTSLIFSFYIYCLSLRLSHIGVSVYLSVSVRFHVLVFPSLGFLLHFSFLLFYNK